jgi:hypothetical protein
VETIIGQDVKLSTLVAALVTKNSTSEMVVQSLMQMVALKLLVTMFGSGTSNAVILQLKRWQLQDLTNLQLLELSPFWELLLFWLPWLLSASTAAPPPLHHKMRQTKSACRNQRKDQEKEVKQKKYIMSDCHFHCVP